MSTLRASRSPAAKRSKYAFSSAAESGRGNEPGLPARRREKNGLLHKSQTAAESIYINSSPHPMSGQEVPMRMLCAAVRCSLFRLLPVRMANDKKCDDPDRKADEQILHGSVLLSADSDSVPSGHGRCNRLQNRFHAGFSHPIERLSHGLGRVPARAMVRSIPWSVSARISGVAPIHPSVDGVKSIYRNVCG